MDRFQLNRRNQYFLQILSIILTVGLFFSPYVYAVDETNNANESACAEALWQPPQEILNLLFSMSRAKNTTGIHPDKLSPSQIEKLTAGSVVYLDTSDIRIAQLITEDPQSIRFVVQRASPNELQIHNPYYGSFLFDKDNIQLLWGNLYRHKNFKKRSAYLPGEYVQLGRYLPSDPPKKDLELFSLKTRKIETIPKDLLPVVVKFVRVVDNGIYAIEVPHMARDYRIFIVDADDIDKLTVGHGKILKGIFKPVNDVQIQFYIGEKVRFRNDKNLMKEGVILAERQNEFLIQQFDLQTWIKKEHVFKSWGINSALSAKITVPNFFSAMDSINIVEPSNFYLDTLNAAAKFSSHPSFLKSSFVDQLMMLVSFQQVFLPWIKAGNTVERMGLANFSEVLCSGAGVCRHNTPMMAAILSEAGVKFRIQFRIMNDAEMAIIKSETAGHTWLEVDSPDGKTFVVDPSGVSVKSLAAVLEDARKDPTSSDALWWGHPDRKELPTSTYK